MKNTQTRKHSEANLSQFANFKQQASQKEQREKTKDEIEEMHDKCLAMSYNRKKRKCLQKIWRVNADEEEKMGNGVADKVKKDA